MPRRTDLRNGLDFLKAARIMMQPGTAERIAEMGNSFSNVIRTAMGPEALRESAKYRFVWGEITLAQLEHELDRINQESIR